MTRKRALWEKVIPGRENSEHECPKVGVCPMWIEHQGAHSGGSIGSKGESRRNRNGAIHAALYKLL